MIDSGCQGVAGIGGEQKQLRAGIPARQRLLVRLVECIDDHLQDVSDSPTLFLSYFCGAGEGTYMRVCSADAKRIDADAIQAVRGKRSRLRRYTELLLLEEN